MNKLEDTSENLLPILVYHLSFFFFLSCRVFVLAFTDLTREAKDGSCNPELEVSSLGSLFGVPESLFLFFFLRLNFSCTRVSIA